MKFLQNKDHRIIAKNFSYLSVLKLFNIGFKFILIAYLVRVLGTDLYGLLTWSDSIIQFFLMFINFGFNVYAAKYIVDHRKNKDKISEVVSSIYVIKSALFLISFLLLLLTAIFDPISENLGLLCLMLIMGIGEVLFPIWYFQGIEKLKTATIIVFISRFFIVVTTVLLVTKPEDIWLYVGLIVLSNAIMGILGVYTLVKYHNIKFHLVNFKTIVRYFNAAIMFFFGRFLLLVFNYGTIFLIGIYATMDDVTGFDVASKIVLLAVIPFEMLQQAVFPSISRTMDKELLTKLVFFSLGVGIVFMIVIQILSPHLVLLFGGEEILEYINTLKFLSILAPIISVTFILGSCGLVAFGFFKEYNYSLLFSSIVYIVLVLILYFMDYITFWNLIYLRVFSDFVLVAIRAYYSINRKVLFQKNTL